jgi:general secretion pathway protein J
LRKRQTRRVRATQDDGFTLVELLVSLALLSMIAALLSSALWSGRQILEATERAQSRPSIDAVRHLLNDLLTGARLVAASPGAEEKLPSFRGGASSASFVTLVEKRGQYAGLYNAEITLGPTAQRASGSALVLRLGLRRETPSAAGVARAGDEQYEVMAGVERLLLRYYGRIESEQVPRWHGTWAEPNRLPTLVGLQLSVAADLQRPSPELVIGLPLAVDLPNP